jgi:hypothetical protein
MSIPSTYYPNLCFVFNFYLAAADRKIVLLQVISPGIVPWLYRQALRWQTQDAD